MYLKYMDTVSIEDFAKLDIRVCKIVKAEKVEGAIRLLRLTLDDGSLLPRIILSGIALSYPEPEKLVGLLVSVIINLVPREIMGEVSNGMMLCSSNASGLPIILPPISEVSPGS